MPPAPPLDYGQVYDLLLAQVEMVLFGQRNIREPAHILAARSRDEQDRFVSAVQLIARNSVELAYFFCRLAPPALGRLDGDEWQPWVLHIMDKYDLGGVRASIVAMEKLQDYLEYARQAKVGIGFGDVAGLLERFVLGLNGRPLRLAAADQVYTDTETLFLPSLVSTFPEREANYRIYKAMVVHQWAQTWFGTWRMSLQKALTHFDDAQRALALFHSLETLRLDARIARELPGVYREMEALRRAAGEDRLPEDWQQAARRLRAPGARVDDSYQLLPGLVAARALPLPCCYQGELLPDQAEAAIAARTQQDKQSLQHILRELIAEHDAAHSGPAEEDKDRDQDRGPRLQALRSPDPDRPDSLRIELELDGTPLVPTPDLHQAMDSIVQDLGDIPDDYLTAAGHGGYDPEQQPPAGSAPAEALQDEARRYPEWDHVRQQYRKDWCLLRERDVHPEWDGFVTETLRRRRGLLKHLRRTFEALRGDDKRLKKQPYGDDIDIDAMVESIADQRAGLEAKQQVFIQQRRLERNIAVLFMVDMSGSTKGWINDTERESLVLLCESLETLGDRYAIYGFTSYTHKRCEVLRIKRFDEPFGALVSARISGIRPREYTRMGAAIRHLSGILEQVEARTKLLVTLSDGRPDDMDGYRGTYGIEDTRQALLETRNLGIHPFCITIDDEAMDYLPHMYGPNGFTVVDRVDRLPYKVSDIYRRLTM